MLSFLSFETTRINPWTVAAGALFVYWLLCRSLRWHRVNKQNKKYKGRNRYSLSVDEARQIVNDVFDLESCYFATLGTAFGLFRTYGIPSIAELLIKYFSVAFPSSLPPSTLTRFKFWFCGFGVIIIGRENSRR